MLRYSLTISFSSISLSVFYRGFCSKVKCRKPVEVSKERECLACYAGAVEYTSVSVCVCACVRVCVCACMRTCAAIPA